MAHSRLVQTYTMKVHTLLSKTQLRNLVLPLLITLTAASAFSQSPSPREEKLLNGLKLIMFDAPASDKVTLKVRIHAGSAFDPQGKEGLMKLLAANIFPYAVGFQALVFLPDPFGLGR